MDVDGVDGSGEEPAYELLLAGGPDGAVGRGLDQEAVRGQEGRGVPAG
ncbi:hypothetical protein [Streptomyces sp. NPDC058612]